MRRLKEFTIFSDYRFSLGRNFYFNKINRKLFKTAENAGKRIRNTTFYIQK